MRVRRTMGVFREMACWRQWAKCGSFPLEKVLAPICGGNWRMCQPFCGLRQYSHRHRIAIQILILHLSFNYFQMLLYLYALQRRRFSDKLCRENGATGTADHILSVYLSVENGNVQCLPFGSPLFNCEVNRAKDQKIHHKSIEK